jgi:hypothetical protein
MIAIDKNQSLNPPAGFDLAGCSALGAFLVLDYDRTTYWPNTKERSSIERIKIYLNDMGREVMRIVDNSYYALPEPKPAPISEPKLSLWQQMVGTFRQWIRNLGEGI